ncbi:MAG: dephospho-CoA kinase [Renibacterium salmoninarum]|nr:dephospho-CoA kinase [Renibacterium salmoninarum]
MLSIGLTGGIAAGKSLVAAKLAELGAVLIDADALAREVVAPGTAGLAEVVEAFGPELLLADGSLDRPALAAKIFADGTLRQRLNQIVHPRVRARAAELKRAAGPESIVVQDIPLLVETGQGPGFHLVLVVDVPVGLQLARMQEFRGLDGPAAQERIAAQASRAERIAAADLVIDNSGPAEATLANVAALWQDRLLPFAENLAAGRRAARSGPPILVPEDPSWPAQAARLSARIMAGLAGAAQTGEVLGVDHIGSTSVPGLAAKDVIDLQLRVESLAAADALAAGLAAAGFPVVPGDWADTPKAFDPDPAHWRKRLHGNSDPGRAVNLHVRVSGSAGADYALAFRDWLRADSAARAEYLAEKRRVAALHASDPGTAGYAEAKEPWFTEVAEPALEAWKTRSGWQPPRV